MQDAPIALQIYLWGVPVTCLIIVTVMIADAIARKGPPDDIMDGYAAILMSVLWPLMLALLIAGLIYAEIMQHKEDNEP